MKKLWIPLFCLLFVFTFSYSAFAEPSKNVGKRWEDVKNYFDDLDEKVSKDEKRAIQILFYNGLISGIGKNKFAPKQSLTYAEAVTMYVNTFNLNIDHLRFIKQPQASDLYDKIKNNAWYADAFVKAYYNGVTLPRNVNPNATISKQEFAHYLYQILVQKVGIITTQIWHEYKDMDKVKDEYKASINNLITMNIIELGKKDSFHPSRAINRAESALMLYKALKYYGDTFKNPIQEPNTPEEDENVQVFTEKVASDVNKITIYWGEMPNPGYYVTIDRIEFADRTATIYYTLHYPDPNKYYPMVITTAKASTYVDASYRIQTVKNGSVNAPVETPELARFDGYVVKKENNRALVTSTVATSNTGDQSNYYAAYWYSNIPANINVGHKVAIWHKVGIELTIYPGQRTAEYVVILPSTKYNGAKLTEDAAIRKALASSTITNANLIAPVIKEVQYVREQSLWKIKITETGEAKIYEVIVNDLLE